MTESPLSRLWQSKRALLMRRWEDGAVIYDKASGDTHQVTLQALLVLQALQAAPRSIPDLASALLPARDLPTPEDLDTMESIVLNLSSLGLVCPATA